MGDRVEITCLCGQIQEIAQLQTPTPVKITLCHCDSCRQANGTLCSPSLPLAARPECISRLQHYQVSPNVRRFFCGTCGTNVCRHFVDTDSWYLRAGAVDRIIGGEQVFGKLEKIVQHQFVGDTSDGGLSPYLISSESTPASCLRQDAGQHPVDLPLDPSSKLSTRSILHAACHCRGNEFLISRPNRDSRTCSSPWPDLIRPYHSCSSENVDDQKWWIRGTDKFLAGTCACRSCRLAFASPITCWAFIPKANLFRSDGTGFDFDGAELASYESSQNTYRNFCKNCGTPMFWHNKERPELIDVSVGLLQAEEGARADTWLEWWTERVSFIEEAFEKDFVSAFAQKLRESGSYIDTHCADAE